MRRRLHDLLRRHYRFAQGTTEFYVCAPRLRWYRRSTEYSVMFAGHEPVSVTRDQFVHLDQRLRAEGVATRDEVAREDDDDER